MNVIDVNYSPAIYFCRKEASKYIRDKFGANCAPQTLAKYACEGGGPRFYKFNRNPIYTDLDLDIWVRSKLSEPAICSDLPQAVTEEFIAAMGGDPQAAIWVHPEVDGITPEGDVDIE